MCPIAYRHDPMYKPIRPVLDINVMDTNKHNLQEHYGMHGCTRNFDIVFLHKNHLHRNLCERQKNMRKTMRCMHNRVNLEKIVWFIWNTIRTIHFFIAELIYRDTVAIYSTYPIRMWTSSKIIKRIIIGSWFDWCTIQLVTPNRQRNDGFQINVNYKRKLPKQINIRVYKRE